MKINKLAIAGPDDLVKHEDLLNLQNEYPFVEWGILFSSTNGKPRYPTQNWISKAVNLKLNLSAHFCGWWSREVLENKIYEFKYYHI